MPLVLSLVRARAPARALALAPAHGVMMLAARFADQPPMQERALAWELVRARAQARDRDQTRVLVLVLQRALPPVLPMQLHHQALAS